MESQNKQSENPKYDKKANSDEGFRKLNRAIDRLLLVSRIAVFFFKFFRKAIKVFENLFVASWFGLILIGIWSDNAVYYKIAFSILAGGGCMAFTGKALIELFKKPKKKEPSPPLSEDAKNMMIMSIVMDKFKNDEGYRKQVADDFFKKMMQKKDLKTEGGQESVREEGNSSDVKGD